MEIFIMTDQPVTCPVCGARADIIIEIKTGDLFSQLCKCMNSECHYLFIEQEDTFLEMINQNEH